MKRILATFSVELVDNLGIVDYVNVLRKGSEFYFEYTYIDGEGEGLRYTKSISEFEHHFRVNLLNQPEFVKFLQENKSVLPLHVSDIITFYSGIQMNLTVVDKNQIWLNVFDRNLYPDEDERSTRPRETVIPLHDVNAIEELIQKLTLIVNNLR